MSTQRWSEVRKLARLVPLPAASLLLSQDWRAALILLVALVFVVSMLVFVAVLIVAAGCWMAQRTNVARYWSPLQSWNRDPNN